MGVTARKGQLLQVSVNEQTLVPYVVSTLRDTQLGIALAGRLGLPGADDLYAQEFQRQLAAGDVSGAAKTAADSPNGMLRTAETIQRFQGLPGQPGQPQPVFQYFHLLLERGKLNSLESMELAKPVIAQGRTQFLEKWLTEDKLECSEQLGDLVVQSDVNMALSVYLRANVPEKAVNCFLQRGEYDKIAAYAAKVGYRCDYGVMLGNLARQNPAGALDFAKQLSAGSLVDPNAVVEIFMGLNRIQETTAFLLEALKGNKPEEGYLQTKLLEINLRGGSPQVADAILQNAMFTHYDRQYVAKLCESCGLSQRALEHYTDTDDIKRSLLAMCANPQQLNPEFVLSYFGSLSPEASLDCLRELLQRNMRGNMQIVTQVAAKYNEQIVRSGVLCPRSRASSPSDEVMGGLVFDFESHVSSRAGRGTFGGIVRGLQVLRGPLLLPGADRELQPGRPDPLQVHRGGGEVPAVQGGLSRRPILNLTPSTRLVSIF